MHIAFFSYARLVQAGGFEKYVIDLASALARRGHRVSVVTTGVRGYRLLNVGMNALYRQPLGYDNSRVSSAQLRTALAPATLHEASGRLQRLFLRDADVIYAKNELVDLAALWSRRSSLPPIVCGVHTPPRYPGAKGLYPRLHNALYLGSVYRALLESVSACHFPNPHDPAVFRHFGLAATKPSFAIPLPVRVGSSVEKTVPPASPYLLFAGRLSEQKGVDVLLAATRILHGELACPAPVGIAGSGNPGLVRQVKDAAAADPLIRYLGHLSASDLSCWYGRATAAVVPSRWETFPYACVESLAAGVPVVCTDIPGCRDAVRNGETGLLVPAEQANALARAMRELATMPQIAPERYARFCAAGIAEAKARYSPEHIYERMEAMLQEVRRTGMSNDR